MIHPALKYGLLLSCLTFSTPIFAQTNKVYNLEIPTQSLDKALKDIAQQTGISVSFSRRALKHLYTSPLSGSYNLDEAFEHVLTDSLYTYEFLGETTVRIVARSIPPQETAISMPSPQAIQRDLRLPQMPTRPAKPNTSRDEIIVTAIKRDKGQLLQKAPYGAAVFDGQIISDIDLTETSTLAGQIAGLEMTNLGPSRNKISIRGISDGAFNGRLQSTVGVYLGNTPINFNAPYPELPLVDVKSVNVLRGPQGSLYGTGSLGGILAIEKNQPDTTDSYGWIEGGLSFTQDGGTNHQQRAMLNLAIGSDLALRASGYHHKQEGYVDDIRRSLKNINDNQTLGGRAALLWEISPDWSIDAGFDYQDTDTSDMQYSLDSLDDYQQASYIAQPHDDDFYHRFVNIQGELNWGEITSSTSWMTRNIEDVFDASMSLPVNLSQPISPTSFTETRRLTLFSHESRISAQLTDWIDVLGGVYYAQNDEHYDGVFDVLDDNSEPVFIDSRDDDARQFAIFGEADIELSEDISIVAGGRWFDSKLKTETEIDTFSGTATVAEGSNKESEFLPKLAISYAPSGDVFLYGQLSSGYRVGGLNIDSAQQSFDDDDDDEILSDFEADKLWMYELGAKTDWLDNQLRINIAAFFIDWKNVQSEQILASGFSTILNAGNAKNKGVEVDLTYRPNDSFTLQLNGAFNDPDLTATNLLFASDAEAHLPRIPKLSGGFWLRYEQPSFLGSNWKSTWSANYAYTGRSQLTFVTNDNRRQGRNHQLNGNLVLENGNWRARIFVDNILSDDSNTFAYGNPFAFRQQEQITPVRPTTIGVVLRSEF